MFWVNQNVKDGIRISLWVLFFWSLSLSRDSVLCSAITSRHTKKTLTSHFRGRINWWKATCSEEHRRLKQLGWILLSRLQLLSGFCNITALCESDKEKTCFYHSRSPLQLQSKQQYCVNHGRGGITVCGGFTATEPIRRWKFRGNATKNREILVLPPPVIWKIM